MRAMAPFHLAPILLALTCCSDPNIITETTPFKNLSCVFDPPRSRLMEAKVMDAEATKFAETHGMRRSSNEFSTLLTTNRLNFILTYGSGGPIYAIGIARSAATAVEVKLFDRFISSLPLGCAPAEG